MVQSNYVSLLMAFLSLSSSSIAFNNALNVNQNVRFQRSTSFLLQEKNNQISHISSNIQTKSFSSSRKIESKLAATPSEIDLDVVALVAGQENYGFAIVALGEATWSFLQAPSLDHAKILVPAIVSAAILVAVSGPMITSGDVSSVGFGLEVATAVSVGLGASYLARLLAPYSPSAKEIAFLGLLVALAGFSSFSQNLLVDGFVALPTLPSISLPSISLPSIDLPF